MQPTTFLRRHWPILLIGSMWLWMFWPMISGRTVCGFRDSAYLYYPLFKWIDSVWASGEIPLWNPYCNYGLPVVGDGSSSVFYPGKLIFLCRFLSYPSRYGIYLSVHILIAAAGAYRFTRVMKANQAGATLAAISYAFSGSVLFQVTNVIYLVSAAWLPFALMLVWKGIIGNDRRSAVLAGVTCALMILGGDPQMVYHVGLIAAASVVTKFWRNRRRLLMMGAAPHAAYGWLVRSGLRLGLMIAVTAGLAAVQILPTSHWAARSERANTQELSSVWRSWGAAKSISRPEIQHRFGNGHHPINGLATTISDGFLAAPHPGSAKDATYQFSQPPWSAVELFFPNVQGKPFPTHQRWSDALPGAERIWTPSIYAGVLTAILGLAALQLWGRRRRVVWLSRIGVFFVIASWGWFGAVWLANEVLSAAGAPMVHEHGVDIGPQVGGLYWIMVTVLPKYFLFRYPAKLFVIASLMISVLAGIAIGKRTPLRWKTLAVVSAISAVGLVVLNLPVVEIWFETIRPSLLFGPFDGRGALNELDRSLIQPLVACAGVFAIAWCRRRRTGSDTFEANSRSVPTWIVWLTAIDLMFANRWLLADVQSEIFERPLAITERLTKLKSSNGPSLPRVYRSFDVQARYDDWPKRMSSRRLQEIVLWQRQTLFPKQHLEHSVALLGSFGSVWPAAYRHATRYADWEFADEGDLGRDTVVGECVAAQMICDADSGELRLEISENSVPDFRLVPEVELCPSRYGRGLQDALALEAVNSIESRITPANTERRTLRQISTCVKLDKPLSLVAHTLHDDGWKIQVEDLAQGDVYFRKPLSVDGLWMQTPLEPGNYRVTFTYSPHEFWVGLAISIGSLLALMIFTLNGVAYRRNLTPGRKAAKTQSSLRVGDAASLR